MEKKVLTPEEITLEIERTKIMIFAR